MVMMVVVTVIVMMMLRGKGCRAGKHHQKQRCCNHPLHGKNPTMIPAPFAPVNSTCTNPGNRPARTLQRRTLKQR
jgi:hypothetical protein